MMKNSANEIKPPSKIPWPSTIDGYVVEEVIGSGATSIVHSAYCTSKMMRVAIKRIDLEKCSCSIDEMQKEIQAMSICNHENVASYYTSFVHKSELWIVMKLLDGGSVLDLISHLIGSKLVESSEGVLDEAVIAIILKEVLKGLVYFHQNGQIHRDVKAGNILLGMDGTVQLGDFGVSSTIQDYDDMIDQQSRMTFVGTPCWMAPEVMEQISGYNNKVDIWSFGITAIELATGTAPYAKYPAMKVLKLTLLNDPPSLETCADYKPDSYKKYSKSFRKMLTECLQKNPDYRPEAKTLLKHKFFKSAKSKEYLQEYLKTHASSIRERSKKVEKILCSSGRMMKTDCGDWIWPDESGKELEVIKESEIEKIKKMSSDKRSEKLSEKESPNLSKCDEDLSQIQNNNLSSELNHQFSSDQNANSVATKATTERKTTVTKKTGDHIIYKIVFRLRNKKNEINEIDFTFDNLVDTCDGLVQEMVGLDLIDGNGRVAVAANLEKVISGNLVDKKITFALQSRNADPNEIADEKRLVGYAQLVLVGCTKVDEDENAS